MTSIKNLLPTRTKAVIWKLASKHLHLNRTLASGCHIKIASYADWCIYNDIFVEGEYDTAIDAALRTIRSKDSFQIVDLGANVGFFTLRVFDKLKRSGYDAARVEVLCVEASHSLEAELHERLRCLGKAGVSVRIANGLVGERIGQGRLELASSQIMNRVTDDPGGAGLIVPYWDVEAALAGRDRIHLLKCDIEGSEGAFLRNYQDLLRRTDFAVFEFHAPACSREAGTAAVLSAGFKTATLLLDQGSAQTVFFER